MRPAHAYLAAMLELYLHDAVLDAVVARPLVAVGRGIQHGPLGRQLELPPVVRDPVLLAAAGGRQPCRRRGGGGRPAASPATGFDGQARPGGVAQAAADVSGGSGGVDNHVTFSKLNDICMYIDSCVKCIR